MGGCGVGGALTGIALVDIGDVDIVSGDGLHGSGKLFDLATIFGASWCNMKRKQMTQRVYRHVKLRTLLAFATVIAGTLAALGREAQRPAIDDRGGRLGRSSCRQTQYGAQIVYQRFEATRRKQTLCLLVHCGPGWQIVRHPPPWRASFHDVAQAIEHFTQAVFPLTGILSLQRQIRRDQRPFFIGYVRRIRLATRLHSNF